MELSAEEERKDIWADESSNNHIKGQDLENIQKSSGGQAAIIAKDRNDFVEDPATEVKLDRSRFTEVQRRVGGTTPHFPWQQCSDALDIAFMLLI